MKRTQHAKRVKDVMQSSVVSVGIGDSINLANSVRALHRVNTLVVLAKEKPVGLITEQIVERAIHHKLGEDSVADYMIRRFSVAKLDENLSDLIPIIMDEKQDLIPVADRANKLVGVVRGEDVLQVIKANNKIKIKPILDPNNDRNNIKGLLKERFGEELLKQLVKISEVANKYGTTVSMVGGFVRDLLLNITNKDIDIVVEGDGIDFAGVLADEFEGKVKSHEKFGTSVIWLPDGNRIDVATARLEYYDCPAALPTIKQSSLRSDLYRRDFTINSIAIKLNGDEAFSLVDLFNGETDLKKKEINVLHNLSFIEDPCRLFRSIRFEQRLGFKLSKQAEFLFRNAIKKKMVGFLSGTRLFNEIKLVLKEKNSLGCILRMKELAILECISSEIILSPLDLAALKNIKRLVDWVETVSLPEEPEIWYIYFLAILYSLNEKSFSQTMDRLQVPVGLKKLLKQDRIACKEGLVNLRNDKDWKPEKIYNLFSKFSVEAIIYFLSMADTDRANQYANVFFCQYYRRVKLFLKGDDLLEMGMKPGPVFQSVFKALREAHIKGEVETRDEELDLVRKQFF